MKKWEDYQNLAGRDRVCFFSPTRPGDGRMEVMKETWAKNVISDVYFVLSNKNDTESYIDLQNNEIHIAYNKFVDSTGKIVPEYDTDTLKGWQAPLVAKMMKWWEYMAMTFDDTWAQRCAWFVKTDDDTWLNAQLIKQRLKCMDPNKEINFGYSCGFGVGIFTGYSRGIVRLWAYFIQKLRKEVVLSDP
eukprot:CAMPEP_0197518018 /NCGR_PEP_ID=MMETSP1318-20131121/3120_1 /TAXON_ID=552666 /ORGANISM="Partenskyella glossopodia, Strain RCC365" /LENGTH=188 /DNA_ID=CAMNT_0043068039 /DNA_START=734 /DNA_END=1300 /DNA_ORIENTATION=-